MAVPIIREAIAAVDAVLLPVQASELDVLGQDAAWWSGQGMHGRALIRLNRVEGRSKPFADKIENQLKTQTRLPVLRIAQRIAYALARIERAERVLEYHLRSQQHLRLNGRRQHLRMCARVPPGIRNGGLCLRISIIGCCRGEIHPAR